MIWCRMDSVNIGKWRRHLWAVLEEMFDESSPEGLSRVFWDDVGFVEEMNSKCISSGDRPRLIGANDAVKGFFLTTADIFINAWSLLWQRGCGFRWGLWRASLSPVIIIRQMKLLTRWRRPDRRHEDPDSNIKLIVLHEWSPHSIWSAWITPVPWMGELFVHQNRHSQHF